MAKELPLSHNWVNWQDQQNNITDDMFDQKFSAIRFGTVKHEVKGKCAGGAIRFIQNAGVKGHLHENYHKLGYTVAGDWKGALFNSFGKIKMNPVEFDCHFDHGRMSFFDGRWMANFFSGAVISRDYRPIDLWNWVGKWGCTGAGQFHGWNVYQAAAFQFKPNKLRKGPGEISSENHITWQRNCCELQFSNWGRMNPNSGQIELDFMKAYVYNHNGVSAFARHTYGMGDLARVTDAGVHYKAPEKLDVGLRTGFDHKQKLLTNELGISKSLCGGKLFLKSTARLPVSLGDEQAPSILPNTDMALGFKNYFEHKLSSNFEWKGVLGLSLKDKVNYTYGFTLTSL